MRILYDSKLPQYKTPFGTLTPGQVCTVHIHIPCAVGTTAVTLLLKYEDGKTGAQDIPLEKQSVKGAYEVWGGVPAKFIKKADPEQTNEINRKIAHNYAMYASWYK